MLAPAWCAPVYARMRGVGRVIETPIAHGRLDWHARARRSRASSPANGYTRAIVLPNSWKSALVPWLARIPRRTGYRGEARYGLLNDARRLDRKALPRLVDRFAALAVSPRRARADAAAPGARPRRRQSRRRRARARGCAPIGRSAILCPGAEYGPPSAGRPTHFAELAARLPDATACRCGSSARRTTSSPPNPCCRPRATPRGRCATSPGAPTSAPRSTCCRSARVVVSNDSGLMHAAAAVGVPLVALFGSSSPVYTPPLSPWRRSRGSTSRAAPASSASARSGTSSACAISRRARCMISRARPRLGARRRAARLRLLIVPPRPSWPRPARRRSTRRRPTPRSRSTRRSRRATSTR